MRKTARTTLLFAVFSVTVFVAFGSANDTALWKKVDVDSQHRCFMFKDGQTLCFHHVSTWYGSGYKPAYVIDSRGLKTAL